MRIPWGPWELDGPPPKENPSTGYEHGQSGEILRSAIAHHILPPMAFKDKTPQDMEHVCSRCYRDVFRRTCAELAIPDCIGNSPPTCACQGRNHVEKSSLESSGVPVAEGAAYLKGRL